jgi:5-bromo-4-chloroindolyl phosphate hydrolysis protein
MPLADIVSMLVERERKEIKTELEEAKRKVSELEKMLTSNQIVEHLSEALKLDMHVTLLQ